MQDMYENNRVTVVRCAVRMRNGLKMKVWVHQGLTLNPLLFVMVTDKLTDEIKQEST